VRGNTWQWLLTTLKVASTLALLVLISEREVCAGGGPPVVKESQQERNIYIQQIRFQLKDGNPYRQIIAIDAIRNIGELDQAIIQQLRELLEDPDPKIRRSAVIALSGGGESAKSSIPKLIELLKDHDSTVRGSSVYALGLMGESAKGAIPKLIDLLQDPDSSVREIVATALGNMGISDKASIPKLFGLLKDSNPNVRRNGAYALGNIGRSEKSVIQPLIEQLKDSDPNVRSSVVNALGNIGEPAKAAISPLIEMLKDSDSNVRSSVVYTLGNMGESAKIAIPPLLNQLEDSNFNVRQSILEILIKLNVPAKTLLPHLLKWTIENNQDTYNGSILIRVLGKLQDEQNKLSLTELQQSISGLEQVLKSLGSQASSYSEIRRTLDSLKREHDNRQFKPIIDLTIKYPLLLSIPAILAGILLFLIIYALLYYLNPRYLLKLPSEFEVPFIKFTIAKSFMHWLKYKPRILDAWVIYHLSDVKENFLALETVDQRKVYIELPGSINKSKFSEMMEDYTNKEFCLLIYGDGGVGKTSLVCQIAHWVMERDDRLRPFEHLMLPILLEQDLDQTGIEGKQFLNAIKGRLEKMVSITEGVSDELLDQLLRHRRLLVIVDHFSELNEYTKNAIKPGSPNFPVKALIVTSRIKEELDKVPKILLNIPPISSSAVELTNFLYGYVKKEGKEDLFKDPEAQIEFNNHCNCLIKMANREGGKKGITVLLATLYAKLMIAQKEGIINENLPTNIPDVMLSYVNELNSGKPQDKFNNRDVKKDARNIAWECLKITYRPKPIHREVALDCLGKDDTRLRYLESLQLLQPIGFDEEQVGFALDPLAEYLAGLYLVHTHSENENSWQDFFEYADKFNPQEIQGFMQAVQECCQRPNSKVPQAVVAQFTLWQTNKLIPAS
jgi:HEAT repeat protein